MGLDPVTGTVVLSVTAVVALAAYLDECEREAERRRRQEEDSKRWRREEREREKDARRREREREREREELARMEEETKNLEWEIEEDERRRRRIRRRVEEDERRNDLSNYNYRMERTYEYYPSEPYPYRSEIEPLFSSYGYSPEENRTCRCASCNPEQTRSRNENFDEDSFPFDSRNPFGSRKNSVTVTFTPPQTTQNKNPNAKTQGSDKRPSSSNGQGGTTSKSPGNASKQNTNSAQKAGPGSNQPQRNNNNNNNNNNKKEDTVQDYGRLNDFIKILKTVLDRCKASAELREKILAFFNKFEKHEENFLRILEDIQIQSIPIEDVLSIVIKLFQSDYFANDVAYENFIALMEIVAKYIKDERFFEIVQDDLRRPKNKKPPPFDTQRADCLKKVLERNNILTEITDAFEAARKEIVEDNTKKPLDPDFSGIFAKVYHYIKHKDFRGKILTVTEYFDYIRELLILLKGLNPEYVELSNVNHTRTEIVFEVYSTVFNGRFRIVVRAYGPILHIRTFFLKERFDKKAKDGDKYVDGKKKK